MVNKIDVFLPHSVISLVWELVFFIHCWLVCAVLTGG